MSAKPLKRAELRDVEQQWGVFLDQPRNPKRCPNQQFGVYAGTDEAYINDIVADGEFFTGEELQQKIDKVVSPGC